MKPNLAANESIIQLVPPRPVRFETIINHSIYQHITHYTAQHFTLICRFISCEKLIPDNTSPPSLPSSGESDGKLTWKARRRGRNNWDLLNNGAGQEDKKCNWFWRTIASNGFYQQLSTLLLRESLMLGSSLCGHHAMQFATCGVCWFKHKNERFLIAI